MKISLVVLLSLFTIISFGQNNPVIIELFTSQGCSSCPSADKNLTEILEKANKEGKPIYGLSFHVDYWNYIGWKDPYSNKAFTERQRNYAEQLSVRSIYTPQMIVNGREEFVGSNQSESNVAISSALKEKPSYEISLSEVKWGKGNLSFQYKLDKAPTNETINIAIVQNHAENFVSRGENSGRKLSHDNVVKFFQTFSAKKNDSIQLTSLDLIPESYRLILFIQDRQLHVTGAIAQTIF